MKIYSKFQDYYDSALGSFLESDVIVNRQEKTINIGKLEYPLLCYNALPKWESNQKEVIFNKCKTTEGYNITLIGFCGQWYFHWVEAEVIDDAYNTHLTHHYVSYDEYLKDYTEHSTCFKWMQDEGIHVLNDPNKIKEWNTDIFEKYGPVIVIPEYCGVNKWHRNTQYETYEAQLFPCLKNYGFQQLKDPFTALWELEHWYDTHARPDDAIVPVGDDITRLKAYGFDAKTSFRKCKEQR